MGSGCMLRWTGTRTAQRVCQVHGEPHPMESPQAHRKQTQALNNPRRDCGVLHLVYCSNAVFHARQHRDARHCTATGERTVGEGSTAEADCRAECVAGQASTTTTLGGRGVEPCAPCSAGSIAATAAATRCRACAVGQWAPAGASACVDCAAGFSTHPGPGAAAADCKAVCAPGTRSASGLAPCEACPRGFFTSTERATECLACPAGQDTQGNGSSVCVTKCPAGSAGVDSGLGVGIPPCSACSPGSYAPSAATACLVPTPNERPMGETLVALCCPSLEACGENESRVLTERVCTARSVRRATSPRRARLQSVPCADQVCCPSVSAYARGTHVRYFPRVWWLRKLGAGRRRLGTDQGVWRSQEHTRQSLGSLRAQSARQV